MEKHDFHTQYCMGCQQLFPPAAQFSSQHYYRLEDAVRKRRRSSGSEAKYSSIQFLMSQPPFQHPADAVKAFSHVLTNVLFKFEKTKCLYMQKKTPTTTMPSCEEERRSFLCCWGNFDPPPGVTVVQYD